MAEKLDINIIEEFGELALQAEKPGQFQLLPAHRSVCFCQLRLLLEVDDLSERRDEGGRLLSQAAVRRFEGLLIVGSRKVVVRWSLSAQSQ
mgnify:CR=1 FL=1